MVLGDIHDHETKTVRRGVLAGGGFRFFLQHFWSYTIYVVQKTVALGILALLVFSRLLAGIAGIHLLA
jgi:hypothetical protein